MSAVAKLAEDYRAGAALLRNAVAGMTPEQLRARPIAGKWSTLEVVAHIADFEPVLTDRIRRIVALDDAILLAADEDRFAAKLRYHERDILEELAMVDAIRQSTARLLSSLTEQELARTGQHSLRGPLTLQRVVEMAINHIPHHVRFIEEKRKALGL
jgi:uncharacterized damage-inducible protein DinB